MSSKINVNNSRQSDDYMTMRVKRLSFGKEKESTATNTITTSDASEHEMLPLSQHVANSWQTHQQHRRRRLHNHQRCFGRCVEPVYPPSLALSMTVYNIPTICNDENNNMLQRKYDNSENWFDRMMIWERIKYHAKEPCVRPNVLFLYRPIPSLSSSSIQSSSTTGALSPATCKAQIEECPICQMEMTLDRVQTICGHIFHQTCLQQALTTIQPAKCPLCRNGLSSELRWHHIMRTSPSGSMTITTFSSNTLMQNGMIYTKVIKIIFKIPKTSVLNATYLSLCLPYTASSYDLVKRLKFTFIRGILFDVEKKNRGRHVVTSFLIPHLLGHRHHNINDDSTTSLSSHTDTFNFDLSDRMIASCHRCLDKMNIPAAHSWLIP